jgi:hypothetical protein
LRTQLGQPPEGLTITCTSIRDGFTNTVLMQLHDLFWQEGRGRQIAAWNPHTIDFRHERTRNAGGSAVSDKPCA